jgi:Domain of unknown function (DUF3846)
MAIAVAVLPSGDTFTLELGDDSYKRIVEVIGGYIDSVSTPEWEDVVGYVHDEGLLIGLEPNVYASYVFNRPLVGPLVLVGTLNADGESDGEDYDAPERYISEEFAELVKAMNTNEEMRSILSTTVANMDFAPTVIGMTDEQMDQWFIDGTLPEQTAK